LDELDNFVSNGAPEANLAKAKEYLHKQYKANQKQNAYWMNQLNEFYWYKVDMDTDYEKIVDSITMKDVQEFAKALFKQGNRIEVIMTTGDAN
jgi:zinc protease